MKRDGARVGEGGRERKRECICIMQCRDFYYYERGEGGKERGKEGGKEVGGWERGWEGGRELSVLYVPNNVKC